MSIPVLASCPPPSAFVELNVQPTGLKMGENLVFLRRTPAEDFNLVALDKSICIPHEIWGEILGNLGKVDLFACVVLNKRLCVIARQILYRSLRFRSSRECWSSVRFWGSTIAHSYRRVPQSISIGTMELNDKIVKTVMATVASFRNVKSLTVVNQRVLAGDLFRMVNRKDLSSLALSWVIFDQIPTIDASTLWDSDSLVHPASPAKLSLLGVGWNPVNDPDMLLPGTAASENLLEFTLDLRSFLQLRRGFSQAGRWAGISNLSN
ncbi:hypothetical protein PM082_008811 [Marasmius tenuissimus]|nr:hypothetical protein PM082_008811 [Marasmius tenuissimus]